jgi:cyclophilin family peptidyl-prolyl cis-trans isomerase
LRKKKRVVDVDAFTRFSFLNIFIIAQKKRKVNPSSSSIKGVWKSGYFYGILERIIMNIRMKKQHAILGVLAFGLMLSGCTTPEVRQEKEIKDGLNFSDMQKEATKQAQQATPPQAPQPPQPPVTQPVTNKSMYSTQPAMTIDSTKAYTATLETSVGKMVVALNAKETPITVNNFVFLAKEKFYDGTIFHRTIPGFMVQGGDPTGTGMGDPGYKFADEPFTGEYMRGTVAMANSGPDTNGSQFFIMHADYPLPPNYVIFGKVIEGLDVVDTIATAKTLPGGEGSSPVTPVTVTSVTINEK